MSFPLRGRVLELNSQFIRITGSDREIMIHSGLPFFNPLLSVGGVAFPWALQTQTSPPSSPPPSPGSATRVSSFTIDAILGRRHHQHHETDTANVARSLTRRREERLARTAPYATSGISGSHSSMREGSSGVSSGGGGGGGGGGCAKAKAKRVRTIFTAEQLERLEAEFARQQYMVGPERLYLAAALQLTEAQVKVWFQNRRIKWRKAFMEQQHARLSHSPEEGTNDSVSLPSSPLRGTEESSSEELQRVDIVEERLVESNSSRNSVVTSTEPLQQAINNHLLSGKLKPDLQTRHLSDVTDLTCNQ